MSQQPNTPEYQYLPRYERPYRRRFNLTCCLLFVVLIFVIAIVALIAAGPLIGNIFTNIIISTPVGH